MTLTFSIRKADAQDIDGFIRILTDNGYQVTFRKGGAVKMMCDVSDDECRIRSDSNEAAEKDVSETVPVFSEGRAERD